jgi:RNA polymerase sigma-70 factor (ECF subfamily)
MIEQERYEIIKKAVDELPEKFREIISLRHFEELDYSEIAERLNMPLGTVKASLFRARKILQLKLKRYKHILLN